MSESHAGYQVPPSQMDDVPIIRPSENSTTSTLQYVKSSEKWGIRSLHVANQSEFFMRYKITVCNAILSIVALLIFSLAIAYMALQSAHNYPSMHIEEKSTTDYVIIHNYDNPKIYEHEEPIDQRSVYGMISENLRNRKKREIRKSRKRRVPKSFGSHNDEDSFRDILRLHRVETGRKIPRETEIIRDENNFVREIYNEADDKSNNEKRKIGKNGESRGCKRSVESCKSLVNSMKTLAKTTGDNVESLNKLMNQININEETKNTDIQKFQAFLDCIECKKIANDDSITFLNDSEQDEAPNNYKHMTNTRTIARMLNEQGSNAGEITERITKIEETKSPSVVNETPMSSTDTIMFDPSTNKTIPIENLEISESPNKTREAQNSSVNIGHTEISTNPGLNVNYQTVVRKRPMIQDDTDVNVPTDPPAIYNLPGLGDTSNSIDTTRTQASAEESSSDSTVGPLKVKSSRSWTKERMVQFDPRIMAGAYHQPANGIYDESSMILPTAETTKTSQQVQYTPPISWIPYPICFVGSSSSGTPSGPPFKQQMPGTMKLPAASSPGTGSYSFPANQSPQRGYGFAGQPTGQGFGPMQYYQQQAIQFRPGQQFPYGNAPMGFQQGPYLGPTAPGSQGFFPTSGNHPTGLGQPSRSPYYCTYMPAPTYQFPPLAGISEFQRNVENPRGSVGGADKSYDFARNSHGTKSIVHSGYGEECASNYRRCNDGSQCIAKKSWCNGRVDCRDASDEMECSCSDRVSKDRICDGYFDCPHGQDELGCFDCPSEYFSCDDSTKNYGEGNCVPLSQRCDGLEHCPNGKDEMDCTILTQSYIENRDPFAVGYTTGYLHKNWQGRWYPACTPSNLWAMDACIAETGFPLREWPRINIESTPPGEYPGPYIVQSANGEIKTVPTCNDKAIHVRCPEIPCGTRVLTHQEINSPYDRSEDYILGRARNATSLMNETTSNVIEHIGNEPTDPSDVIVKLLNATKYYKDTNGTEEEIVGATSRVVGGKASQPKAWPFLVAIHKDGTFKCGGVIINEDWILTAAHCVEGFSSHYYEIEAGLLRRFSFSPMPQTRRANYIKIHPDYQRDILKNDLALIKLDEPLLFNRWIRPTCLPMSWRAGTNSRKQPFPDTTCITAGWGETFSHEPYPDHLREVEIPITRECKYPEDQNDAEICAGVPQGGRDACQGDSGGPLMCKYLDSVSNWYVAGIVSHGEGCALPNEPGAYTKVSRFVDWINGVIHNRDILVLGPKPRKVCPGFSCDGGLGKCLPAEKRCDRVVNCLDAEDEINCEYHSLFVSRRPNDDSENQRSRGSEIVGQAAPGFGRKNENVDDLESIFEDETWTENDSEEELTFIDDESSTTKSRVEQSSTTSSTVKNNDQSSVMNITGFQPPTTTTMKPQTQEYSKLMHFTCNRLIQSLPIEKRCNRVIDCEDGTDEDNCTCKDYLANLYPKAICNGHVDCYDGSDEEKCAFCRDDEFACSRSGTCISRTKVCDRSFDCDNAEDELDCFVLTNGDHVIIDIDKRPHLNLEGVVTRWKNNAWSPLCLKSNGTNLETLANEFCVYFGYGSAESSKKIKVHDRPIEIRESRKYYVLPYEYPPLYISPNETDNTCNGIYVRCKPILSASANKLMITNPSNNNADYLWPWQAAIFVNGHYHCPAILLDHSWLLASSRCVRDLDLNENYTMALVGMAPTYLYVDSPYQQMTPIDKIKVVKNLDAALLHLESSVNVTRYVQPIFIQKRIFPATRRDVCLANGVDEKYHPKTTFLQPVPEPCPQCHRCYKNATFEDCKNKTSSNWSGTIVCRGSGTWYPAAIFHEKDILCGFQSVQTLTSIDYGNAHLTEIMDEDLQSIVGPNCEGFRCPLGKCISWESVCDGIDDCRDRSDENSDYCGERKKLCETNDGIGCKCTKSELRCANGQCVPKEAFCDFKIDCADGSDETPNCTCADYLRLTAPDRLCNNVRDCYDKSDENSEECSCKDASFKCSGGTNHTETSCVSHDFVCDGKADCPNGEDEKICRTVKGDLRDPPGTGEVLRRSYGVWYSECFPSPLTSTKEISDLCRSIGYNRGEALKFTNDKNPYGPPLILERDDFYVLRTNRRTWIAMRNNRPLAELVTAREPCHRAFVRCTQ